MKRAVTALGLIAVATYLIFWAPDWVFLAAAICMGLLCYVEYSDLVAAHGISRSRVLGILAGLLILLWPEETLMPLTLLAALALAMALRDADLRRVLPQDRMRRYSHCQPEYKGWTAHPAVGEQRGACGLVRQPALSLRERVRGRVWIGL